MKQDERQVKQQQDEKARGSAELTSAQHSITSQLHPMLGGQTIAALQQPQPATRVSTLHQPMVPVTLAADCQTEVRHLFRVANNRQIE